MNTEIRNRFCNYVYVTGDRKGKKCERFCRLGRNFCYVHIGQTKKLNNKEKLNENIETNKVDVNNVEVNKVEVNKSSKRNPIILEIEKEEKIESSNSKSNNESSIESTNETDDSSSESSKDTNYIFNSKLFKNLKKY